jgi:hypothetical protein
MTVGQRRGVLPGRDGEKRYVAKVDIAGKRVEVGRLEEILVSEILLDEPSLTFCHDVLADETQRVGPVERARSRAARDAAPRPRRAVAAGGSNCTRPLARSPRARPWCSIGPDEPEIVEGAAIVVGS